MQSQDSKQGPESSLRVALYERIRNWHQPNKLIPIPKAIGAAAASHKLAFKPEVGSIGLHTALEAWESSLDSHVLEAIQKSIQNGSLAVDQVLYQGETLTVPPDVDALGALDDETTGSQNERKAAAAANAIRRRRSFTWVQQNLARLHYFDKVCGVHHHSLERYWFKQWHDGTITDASSAALAAPATWAAIKTKLQAKAALQRETHALVPVFHFLLAVLYRPLYQQKFPLATDLDYYSDVELEANMVQKSLDITFPPEQLAALVWPHLSANSKEQLRTKVYVPDGATDAVEVRFSFKQIGVELNKLAPTHLRGYSLRDSSSESKLLSNFFDINRSGLAKTIPALASLDGKARPRDPNDPSKSNRPRAASEPQARPVCKKCHKISHHSPEECRSSEDHRIACDGKQRGCPKNGAAPAKKSQEPADPKPSHSKKSKPTTTVGGPVCWNCGRRGHNVGECRKPRVSPLPFKPSAEVNTNELTAITARSASSLPEDFPVAPERAPSVRDLLKVRLPRITSDGKVIVHDVTLLDNGATDSLISWELGKGYPRVNRAGNTTIQALNSESKLEGWVRVPYLAGKNKIVWLTMALMKGRNSYLSIDCMSIISRYDYLNLLKVDMAAVEERHDRGERFFDATFRPDSFLDRTSEVQTTSVEEETWGYADHEADSIYETYSYCVVGDLVSPSTQRPENHSDGLSQTIVEPCAKPLESEDRNRKGNSLHPQKQHKIHEQGAVSDEQWPAGRNSLEFPQPTIISQDGQRFSSLFTPSAAVPRQGGEAVGQPLPPGLTSEFETLGGGAVPTKPCVSEEPSLVQVNLAEKWCRDFLQTNRKESIMGDPSQEDRKELAKSININPDLSPAIFEKLKKVFSTGQTVLSNFPGKISNASVSLELNPDAAPYAERPRPLGPAQTTLITSWIQEQVKLGLYEPASTNCQWASNIHLVPTYTTVNGVRTLKKVRVTGDYRRVNRAFTKVVQEVPNIDQIKLKLRGFKYYAKFDQTSGFNSVKLDEPSRDILAIWTPLGLMRPTVLPFGPTNGPTKFQRISESMLKSSKYYNINLFVYIDDIIVGANSEEELLVIVADVVNRVRLRGGHLRPDKIRIGYPTEVLLGSEFSAEGQSISPAHIEAIKAIRPPTTVKEAQQVLGLFTYFFQHIEWYARRSAPLRRYAVDGAVVPNPLPGDALAALEWLKETLTSPSVLVPFDPKRRLYIDSDSSLLAAGWCVYHIKGDKERQPIAFFSKKYSSNESAWAPYVREAFALYLALKRCYDFVQASAEPPIVLIDQKPLLWLWKATSPKVVRWVVECLQELDYELRYRPGPEHLAADALSRVPCVEPGLPSDVGVVVAFNSLLDKLPLPGPEAPNHVVWISAPGIGITALRQKLRRKNRRLEDGAVTARSMAAPWDYAMVVPESTRAPAWTRKLLLTKRPVAVLLPTDLLHLIYSPDGDDALKSEDLEAKKLLVESSKVVYSADNLTWVISNWPSRPATEVLVAECQRPHERNVCPPMEAYSIENASPDLRRFRQPGPEKLAKATMDDKQAQAWMKDILAGKSVRVDGGEVLKCASLLAFRTLSLPDQEVSMCPSYCPESLRRDVIFAAHLEKNHARAERLTVFIQRTYWWPALVTSVKTALNNCHFCLVARARRLMRHSQYQSMKLSAPHQGYGMDLWGPLNIDNVSHFKYLLTIVDLFHGYVRYYPLRTKASYEIVTVAKNYLWDHVGYPEFTLVDNDTVLTSELASAFCAQTGIEMLRTAPYSPWELGRVERRHQDLNLALKALDDKSTWPDHLPGTVASASNSLPSKGTGVCPAEVEYGYIPRSPFEAKARPSAGLPAATQRAINPNQLVHHVSALKQAKRIYTVLADRFFSARREEGVRKLNAQAVSPAATSTFKVGDKVAVFYPRKVRGVPSKSLVQWRSGYKVVEVIPSGFYVCQHADGSSRRVRRNDLVIDRSTVSLDGAAEEFEARQPGTLAPFAQNQLVACADHLPTESGNFKFHLARFVSIHDGDPDWISVRYLGTSKKTPPYRFSNVWHDAKDDKVMLKHSRPSSSKNVTPWTGVEPTEHVLPVDVQLTSSGALTSPTLKALQALNKRWAPTILS